MKTLKTTASQLQAAALYGGIRIPARDAAYIDIKVNSRNSKSEHKNAGTCCTPTSLQKALSFYLGIFHCECHTFPIEIMSTHNNYKEVSPLFQSSGGTCTGTTPAQIGVIAPLLTGNSFHHTNRLRLN